MSAEIHEALATNLYFDRQFGARAAKVLPGEFYVTSQDMLIVTVLGSCVAACIRDSESGIGGMNHFMLPDAGGDGSTSSWGGESARYGGYAMEMLINDLLKRGASRSRLETKVFGGGAVLAGFTSNNVGERNGRFVLDHPAFVSGDFDTHFVQQYFTPEKLLASQQDGAEVAARWALQLHLGEKRRLKVVEGNKGRKANWQ